MSRAPEEPSDWTPECGRAGWARLVAGSGIRFGVVIENGRVLVDEREWMWIAGGIIYRYSVV